MIKWLIEKYQKAKLEKTRQEYADILRDMHRIENEGRLRYLLEEIGNWENIKYTSDNGIYVRMFEGWSFYQSNYKRNAQCALRKMAKRMINHNLEHGQ